MDPGPSDDAEQAVETSLNSGIPPCQAASARGQ